MKYIVYDRDGNILKVTDKQPEVQSGEFLYLMTRPPAKIDPQDRIQFSQWYPKGIGKPWPYLRDPVRHNDVAKVYWRDDGFQMHHSPHIMGVENVQSLQGHGIPCEISTVSSPNGEHFENAIVIQQMRSSRFPCEDAICPVECGYFMADSTLIPYAFIRRFNDLDHVFTPSEFSARAIQDSGCTAPITVWRHGVNIDVFRPVERPESDICHFLYVGTTSPRKGVDGLLKAFSEAFSGDYKNKATLTVKIAGPDSRIEALISELGIADCVNFIDQVYDRNELAHLYREHDVFVFPTFAEAFGMPALEAMASGLPVIYTDWSALKEFAVGYPTPICGLIPELQEVWAHNEEHGLWAQPDTDALIQNMRDAADNQVDRVLLGKDARKKAETMTWQETAIDAANVLKSFLGGTS